MASGQIRLTPQQMRVRAKEFKTEGTNFDTSIKKMERLINNLKGEWEGQASQKFESQFNSLKPSFNKMKQLIDDIGGQLDATATAVEKLDSEIAKKFKA